MKNTTDYRTSMNGQALIILLFYMIIAITLTTTAVALIFSNSIGAMREEESSHALEVAESGIENALLRLLRNNSYSGETLSVGNGSSTITVSGNTTKTITSVGVVGDFSRTLQVTATISAGILTTSPWKEL